MESLSLQVIHLPSLLALSLTVPISSYCYPPQGSVNLRPHYSLGRDLHGGNWLGFLSVVSQFTLRHLGGMLGNALELPAVLHHMDHHGLQGKNDLACWRSMDLTVAISAD